MKLQITGAVLFIVSWMLVQGKSLQQGFDKTVYYSVMASGNIDAINKQIEIVQASSIPAKEAFEGTLLMKKSGLIKKLKEKLHTFKLGHAKLETSIKKDNENAELRFLRVMIQEHAPEILKYKGDLKKDKEQIKRSFKTISPDVQKFIIDYSKQSKVLDPRDFQF